MARADKSAFDAFAANRERVSKALAELNEAILSLESGSVCNPRDWGYAGSMGHIAEVVEDLNSGFADMVGNARDAQRARQRVVDACEGDAEMAEALIGMRAGPDPTLADLLEVAEHAEEVQAETAEKKAGWSSSA